MKDSPMNEKLSLQFMAEALSQRSSVPKKVAESFIRAFFDTIVESVKNGEDLVKIDGFGSFKRVAVDSRESVNVSNGERIVIAGYNKLTFSPDDSAVDMLRARRDEAEHVPADSVDGAASGVSDVSDTVGSNGAAGVDDSNDLSDADGLSDVSDSDGVSGAAGADGSKDVSGADGSSELFSIDDLIEVEEPACVECAADEFSGIDLLISTPESVDDVRRQLNAATAKVAEAIDMAKKASAEKARLERLLCRLESNAKPEADAGLLGSQLDEEDGSVSALDSSSSSSGNNRASGGASFSDTSSDACKGDAFARVMTGAHVGASGNQCDGSAADGGSGEKGGKRRWWFVGIAACAVAALLSCIVYFVYGTFTSIEKVEDVAVVKKPKAPLKHDNNKEAGNKEGASSDTLFHGEPKDAGKASDKGNGYKVEESKASISGRDESPAKQEEPDKVSRPATYVVKKGETLTRIALRVYGTKDSVKAIIRMNTLVNPNNVPAGAKIKLP